MKKNKMKILVLNLNRLGDIFQSWPVLNALKREHPESEIHLLVRERYAQAAYLSSADRIWVLPTRDILKHFILDDGEESIQRAYDSLTAFLDSVPWENFNQVYNISFSPISADLNYYISQRGVSVKGYSRHSDGSLDLPDNVSAYYYAQGGIGKPNAMALTEIFAQLCGVELSQADWCHPLLQRSSDGGDRILVHIGASDDRKTLDVNQWVCVISNLLKMTNLPILVLGSFEEKQKQREIREVLRDEKKRIHWCVGETNLEDVFEHLSLARFLVAGDSSLVHMASLVNCPVFYIASSYVKYWETGPMSEGSQIFYWSGALTNCDMDHCIQALHRFLLGERTAPFVGEGRRLIDPLRSEDLLAAMYADVDQTFDAVPAIRSLRDALDLSMLQLQQMQDVIDRLGAGGVRDPAFLTYHKIFMRCEEIFEKLADQDHVVGTWYRWFQAEKIRIGPQAIDDLLKSTASVYSLCLEKIDKIYRQLSSELLVG